MIEKIRIEYTEELELEIKIKNKDFNKLNINKLTKKVLGEAFKKEYIPYNFFVLIVFANKDEIKKINNQYRNINKTTDVLSFPMFNKEELNSIIKYNKDKNIENKNNINELSINLKPYIEDEWLLGEVYINLEKIKEQSIEYNHLFERELAYILIHSFYHLLGYDHLSKKDKKNMREKEEILLEYLNIKRGNIYE